MRTFFSFLSKYCSAALGALYLLTFGVVRGENRARLAGLAALAGWRDPKRSFPMILPEIDPEDIVHGDIPVTIHEPVSDDGNVTLLELLILTTLVCRTRPRSLFEFGTFDGRTTLNLAANAPESAVVYTLDLPPTLVNAARANPDGDTKFAGKAQTGAKFLATPFSAQIRQLLGDSAAFDPEPYARTLDFIFIDGAHSPLYVARDTENARLLARGTDTIFAWHDYCTACEGVTKVLNGLYTKGGEWKRLRHIRGTALAVLLPTSLM